jgi:hypothetical protein
MLNFLHWAAAILRGLVEFKKKISRPLFTSFLKPKISGRIEDLKSSF